MSAAISLQHLRTSFHGTEVFRDVNLEVPKGTVTALVGPNGSGKTTLLNILAGILVPDAGHVSIEPRDRFHTSYVFQNYRESLLPWRTNLENVTLPLLIQRQPARVIRERVSAVQEIFDFACPWSGYPYHLSGGQQQVLAFMRALVTYPEVLLLDEPFSALDFENTLRLREHLQTYYLAHKPTIVHVTHDIDEAVHLANRIVVFSRKPTTVLGSVENTAAYPRTLETLKSPYGHALTDEVLTLFQTATDL